MKFFDLSAQRETIKHEINNRIARVMEHGQFILGPEVIELEERLVEYTGAKYCITCANGTDALQISLMALGVGPGDEVITPAFSYIATATTVHWSQANYVDVDPVNSISILALTRKRYRENQGNNSGIALWAPADFEEINKIARMHNLIVIEDGAQVLGRNKEGKNPVTYQILGVCSFQLSLSVVMAMEVPFSHLMNLAKLLRQIARHGQEERYYHTRWASTVIRHFTSRYSVGQTRNLRR